MAENIKVEARVQCQSLLQNVACLMKIQALNLLLVDKVFSKMDVY